MCIIDLLQESKSQAMTVYTELLSKYKPTGKIFSLYEGKDDPAFYDNKLINLCPAGVQHQSWQLGGKYELENVRKMITLAFEKGQSPRRETYYVDSDFSKILGCDLLSQDDVYVTDQYSLENHVCSSSTLKKLSHQSLGFSALPDEAEKKLVKLYEKSRESFESSEAIKKITLWCLNARKNKLEVKFSKIKISNYIKFNADLTVESIEPTTGNSYYQSIDQLYEDVNSDGADFKSLEELAIPIKDFVRGKFILWHYVEFIKLSISNAHFLFGAAKPKTSITVSEESIFNVSAILASCPPTLTEFVNNRNKKLKSTGLVRPTEPQS